MRTANAGNDTGTELYAYSSCVERYEAIYMRTAHVRNVRELCAYIQPIWETLRSYVRTAHIGNAKELGEYSSYEEHYGTMCVQPI